MAPPLPCSLALALAVPVTVAYYYNSCTSNYASVVLLQLLEPCFCVRVCSTTVVLVVVVSLSVLVLRSSGT